MPFCLRNSRFPARGARSLTRSIERREEEETSDVQIYIRELLSRPSLFLTEMKLKWHGNYDVEDCHR